MPRKFNSMPTPTHSIHSINFHVDRVDMGLRCAPDAQPQLFTMLEQAGFRRTRHSYIKGGNYRCIDNLFSKGFGVGLVIHSQRRSPIFRPLRLAVHDPTPDFIEFLLSVFDLLGISSKLSLVEFAFDVTPAEGLPHYLLEQKIVSTLFLTYQHKSKPSGSYQGLTYYTTNIRSAAKGHRVYQKTVDGQRVIRVELVLHCDRLKAMGISLDNLMAIQPQVLRKYVQFKTLNFDRLAATIINRMLGTRKGQPISTGTNRPHVTQLVKSTWRSVLSCHEPSQKAGEKNFKDHVTVMSQWERLCTEPSIKNPNQYLEQDKDFEQEFWGAVDSNFREEEQEYFE